MDEAARRFATTSEDAKAVLARNVILFAGAGLSMSVGLPFCQLSFWFGHEWRRRFGAR